MVLRSAWRSPSNIALVKYWGKKDNQLPTNPSISFSLSKSFTETIMEVRPGGFGLRFLFESMPNPSFASRIEKYLKSLATFYPWILDHEFLVESRNSFPHSAGIASSASAMSALALCLSDLNVQMGKQSHGYFISEASTVARLGSGSAARSVFGGWCIWGEHPDINGSSQSYATPLLDTHSSFAKIQDSILLIDKGTKAVSSSLGHKLMEGHPFAAARFRQAFDHSLKLIGILKNGDWDAFIDLAELEALSLHAMMMTSHPSFILMKANTLKAIEKIRYYRQQTRLPLCFTLDAGPNIHLLYPDAYKHEILRFIADELTEFCANNQWIDDELGEGPQRLEA